MTLLRSIFPAHSVLQRNSRVLFCAHQGKWLSRNCVRKASSSSSTSVDISGVYPPIATPFTATGVIDYGKLEQNFATWNSIDFAGYVVMGSNGESVSLKDTEKLELLRNARKMSKSTSKIIAGLGLPTTDQTIEICNIVADEKSADAALVVSPSFFKGQMNDRVLRKFYEGVADKSRLPVIVYSVPVNTSLDLSSSLVTALAQHPNIIGLKDSGGDIQKISEIINNTPNDFQVLAGSAGFTLPALLMGCVGTISALANVLGREVCELYNLFKRNELEKAVSLQKRLISPNLAVTKKFGVPGLKAAMDASSELYGGPCRLPLLPLAKEDKESVLEAFRQSGYSLNK